MKKSRDSYNITDFFLSYLNLRLYLSYYAIQVQKVGDVVTVTTFFSQVIPTTVRIIFYQRHLALISSCNIEVRLDAS